MPNQVIPIIVFPIAGLPPIRAGRLEVFPELTEPKARLPAMVCAT